VRSRTGQITLQSIECVLEISVHYSKWSATALSFTVFSTEKTHTDNQMSIHPQIIEKAGGKEFVVLPYEEFIEIQQLLEDYEDLQILRSEQASHQNAPTRPLRDILAEC